MKFLALASLTLVTSLSLTGCASTPTLEDQTRLIEYERCLEFHERMADRAVEVQLSYPENYTKAVNRQNLERVIRESKFSELLENCVELRP